MAIVIANSIRLLATLVVLAMMTATAAGGSTRSNPKNQNQASHGTNRKHRTDDYNLLNE